MTVSGGQEVKGAAQPVRLGGSSRADHLAFLIVADMRAQAGRTAKGVSWLCQAMIAAARRARQRYGVRWLARRSRRASRAAMVGAMAAWTAFHFCSRSRLACRSAAARAAARSLSAACWALGDDPFC